MEATKRPPNIGLKRPPNIGLNHNSVKGRPPSIIDDQKPCNRPKKPLFDKNSVLKSSRNQLSYTQKHSSVSLNKRPFRRSGPMNIGLVFGLLLSLVGCCYGKCSTQQSDILNCELRTLASSLNDTNSAGQCCPEVSKSKEIHIGCSDNGLESILRTNHFGYLPHLKKLSIESCLVKKMPALAFSGLSGLQGLNFVNNVRQQGKNEAKVILEIESDAFTGLNDLRSLNFRY